MAESERITEGIVRDHFKNDPLFNVIRIEEQKTRLAKAKKCLSKASKRLTGKPGFPEFIISIPSLPNDIIVIECKSEGKFHKSSKQDKPADFAVDGVLHYADFLADQYNVIAIAVSGTDEKGLLVSSFHQELGGG